MNAVERLEKHHGVGTLADLGLSRYALRPYLESGAVVRLARNAYALPTAEPGFRAAITHDAAVSCVTALRAHGIDVPGDPAVIHLSVPRRRGTGAAWTQGVRRHFEAVAPRRDRLAPPLTAYDRAVTCLPYLDAVALLDLTRHHRRAGHPVPAPEAILARVSARSPTLAHHLRIDVSTAARSFRESAPRLLLRAAGLAVVAGARIPGVGEVDLLVEGRIVVEIDGMRYHADRAQFRRDRRRDRRLAHLGFLVLRYAWEDAEGSLILRDVLDLLEAHPSPRPFSRRVGEADRATVRALRTAAVEAANAGASPSACAAQADELAAVGVPAVPRSIARPAAAARLS